MVHHDDHGTTSNFRDRLAVPILLPVICLAITIALIVGIGEFLLWFGHESFELVGETIYIQVPVALGLALSFLILFTVLSWLSPDDTDGDSHH